MTGKRLTELNLAIPGLVLLFAIGVPAFVRIPAGTPPWHWLIAGGLTLLALFLARTIVDVDREHVSMRFNAPRPRKMIDRHEVEDFRIVDIPWWVGWGFRWWPGSGWCWRAAGSQGVEFKLRSGSTFVIGCKDPERVVAAMSAHANWSSKRAF